MPFAAWFAITLSVRRFNLWMLGICGVLAVMLPFVHNLNLLLSLRFVQGDRKRHDDSSADDGGLEVSAATRPPARTGAVCDDRHVRAQSFDLAGRALDGRIFRLALGVLADHPVCGRCRTAGGMGASARADSDRVASGRPIGSAWPVEYLRSA